MSFHVIPAPSHLQATDLSSWTVRSLVDYEQHPAYAELTKGPTWSIRLKALRRFLPSLAVIKIKRAIRYEMIPLHIRKASGLNGLLKKAGVALSHFFQFNSAHNVSLDEPGLTELDRTFRRQGCAAIATPEATYQNLAALSQPNFERLESRRSAQRKGERDFEASRSYARRDEAKALFEALEALFTQSGVFDTAQAYLGRKVKLIDVNPQINDSSDDFWRRVFPDLDQPTPTCAYFHRDTSGGDIKAIVYMSDVGPDNGPFGYVIGSHLMPLPASEDHVSEANDSNGMAGSEIENRRCFAALPAAWRHKGAFGNDVIDDSPLAHAIQGGLWTITASKGSIVMFDTKGVHRGSLVEQGERRVITCVLG